MVEYIKRSAVVDLITARYENPEICTQEINSIPAADVVPVVYGRWVPTKAPFMNECKDCSVCGYRAVWGHRYNYCPNCGAKMDGGNS